MNAVGIDVSKGRSMVAILRPGGEMIARPYEISHTEDGLAQLVTRLKGLPGETKVVMEHTGHYFEPIARSLHEAGIFVSVVNALLIHQYGNNSIRKVKTDRKDAVKLAKYALDRWAELPAYTAEDENRRMLRIYNRQYNQYTKIKVMLKNNLIALLDQTFPGVNTLFSSPAREDGHEKWVDFAAKFWHCQEVTKLSERAFKERYAKWCKRNGYRYADDAAGRIYAAAQSQVGVLPANAATKYLVAQAIKQLNAVAGTLAAVGREMRRLASLLPEAAVVEQMYGVGPTLGPQLIAEIGDVRRFHSKKALVAFAGIDAPPYQSGNFDAKKRAISKRGSPALRKVLFQTICGILRLGSPDSEVYQYLAKKRAEGKHFYVYIMAGANKFLRIYYARVTEYLRGLDSAA